MSDYPLTSFEMKALAGVVAMECVEETRDLIAFAKKRHMPDEATQNNLISCWKKTHSGATRECSTEYNNLVACLDKNDRRSLKCSKLRNIFESCYVPKVMVKELQQQQS